MGTRISELRKQRGLSRQDLAQAVNISISALGNYERGEREPDAKLIIELAQYFGVTTDYLLRLTNKPMQVETWPTAISKGAVEIVEKIKKTTDKMISSGRFSPYEFEALKIYTEIFEQVGAIDDIVEQEVLRIKKSFPDFKTFSRLDSMQINGQDFREALIKNDPKALEYVKAYDNALNEIQREIYEISLNVGRLILDISPVVTCGGISSTPANNKEPSGEEIQSFYESVNEK